MNERPIIFSGEMARAILDGRKTQTRRLVKPQPKVVHGWNGDWLQTNQIFRSSKPGLLCPYGKAGDRLWVRESFLGWKSPILGLGDVVYQGEPEYDKCLADVPYVKKVQEKNPGKVGNWANIPSIHMPRWASRITLEITNVRVERLQSITQSDIRQEGGTDHSQQAANLGTKDAEYLLDYNWFSNAWNKINGKTHPWSSNPFVWVIDFKVIKRPDNN